MDCPAPLSLLEVRIFPAPLNLIPIERCSPLTVERTEYEVHLAGISRAFRKHQREIDTMIRKRIEAKEDTYEEIAKEFGLFRTAIANRARMMGSKRIGESGSHNRRVYNGKRQKIIAHIKENIENGSLKPGSKIPSKGKMATYFGCSSTTVFNAYIVLQREGFIGDDEYGAKNTVLDRSEQTQPSNAYATVKRLPKVPTGNRRSN